MKKDGVPAFQAYIDDYPGMTLRDYFAGHALVGLLGSGIAEKREQTSEDVASIAYRVADAMLAERERE